MANYYYVKNGGTATGDAGRVATTKSTGSFAAKGASAYYDSVYAALAATTAPVADDFILASHLHDVEYLANRTLAIPDGVNIVSVDDSALDTDLAGATENNNNGDIIIDCAGWLTGSEGAYIKGFIFKVIETSGDDILITADGRTLCADNLSLITEQDSTSSIITLTGNGSFYKFNDFTLGFNNSSQYLSTGDNAQISVFGGSVTVTNGTSAGLIRGAAFGGIVNFTDYDFSSLSSGSQLVGNMAYTMEAFHVAFNRCKLPSNCIIAGIIGSQSQKVDAWSCSTDDGYHYFEYHRYYGAVKESTSVYRVGGSYYKEGAPTTSNFSAQFMPNNNVVEYSRPLEIKIADIELDLTSVNTLTFQLAFGDDSDPIDTFTNAEAWIKLVQNDSDDLALGVAIESKHTDILTTPTDLASSSESWNSGGTTLELSYNNSDKRQIAIDTAVVPTMTNGQVTAYLCIAKYIDTLEIFSCAKPDVS